MEEYRYFLDIISTGTHVPSSMVLVSQANWSAWERGQLIALKLTSAKMNYVHQIDQFLFLDVIYWLGSMWHCVSVGGGGGGGQNVMLYIDRQSG